MEDKNKLDERTNIPRRSLTEKSESELSDNIKIKVSRSISDIDKRDIDRCRLGQNINFNLANKRENIKETKVTQNINLNVNIRLNNNPIIERFNEESDEESIKESDSHIVVNENITHD